MKEKWNSKSNTFTLGNDAYDYWANAEKLVKSVEGNKKLLNVTHVKSKLNDLKMKIKIYKTRRESKEKYVTEIRILERKMAKLKSGNYESAKRFSSRAFEKMGDSKRRLEEYIKELKQKNLI